MGEQTQFDELLKTYKEPLSRERLYKIKAELGLHEDDAIWVYIGALENYQRLYEAMPTSIAAAIAEITSNQLELMNNGLQPAIEKIELQTGANIKTAKNMEERLEAIIRESGDAAKVRLRGEAASATVEIRTAANTILAETVQRIAGEMGSYVAKSIDSQMSEHVLTVKSAEAELAESLGKAKSEYVALNKEINNTKNRLADIQPSSKWEGLIYGMIGAGIGAITMAIAISFGGIHVSIDQPAPTVISNHK
jgi:hypothetical protein